MSDGLRVRWPAVVAIALISCAGTGEPSARPTSTNTGVGEGTTTTTAESPSPSPATSTTSTTQPGPTLGLITPGGVPVSVLDDRPDGYLVLSPCGFEVRLPDGDQIGATTVVLDPGHGGPTDTGAVGHNGLTEKEINLEVARQAAEALAELGIEAVLTRTSDYASPLFVRANLADSLRAELMVSIHHNAPTPGRSATPGVEVFIQEGSDRSARLGGLLWERTRAGLDDFDVAWTAADDAGVMTVLNSRGDDAYGILRHPDTPTALVEIGYISNPPEADLFASPEYPGVTGLAVAEAIEEYLTTDNTGSGFVEGRDFNPTPGVDQESCTDPPLD